MTLVDARGLRCPAPVLRLARAARDAPAGTVIEVWATDPAAESDIRAWARMRGHDFVAAFPLGSGEEGAARAASGGVRPDAVVVQVRVVRD